MTPVGSATAPEAQARLEIDRQLAEAGWTLQHRDEMNLAAAPAIAVREFKLRKGHGFVDYMLFLDCHAVGVCEAKPAGFPVLSVEQGVKANVLFFDRKPGAKEAWTKQVWFYDLRTNKEFTLKQRRLTRSDLDEFVECYRPEIATDANQRGTRSPIRRAAGACSITRS